ncbi:MAG: ABC transporter permease [Candidatus Aminicenantes bacterium]|nr:MAG: ABC transporter permease [Candidatus Aminicenantes bacterium]
MKIGTIIRKEYKQIVKKKSFVISTILTPLIMAAFIFLPMLLTRVGREVKIIEIIDYSGLIQQQFLEKSQRSKKAADILRLKFQPIRDKSQKQKDLIKIYEQKIANKEEANLELLPEYRKKILDKTIDGLILIPGNIEETRRIYYFAINISDFGTNDYITSTVQKIVSEKILTEQNIDLQIVENAIRDMDLGTFKVKKEGTKQTTSGMEYIMSILMLTILFTVIMAYGQLIMRGVIEEKNNRIIEVLISSTNAPTLFYGKIIGIGLAGLTQVAIWALLAAALLGQSSLGINKSIVNFLTPELGIYFVIFFTIGYFMYSILFSIVGASVNTDQEAQQFAAPITYLLIIPYILGIIVTQNPNTPLVILTSLFPLFTPTLMFMRISVAVPSFSQVVISIAMSVLFTMFLAWLGARIFRVGILMYGKKPTIPEIIKWIRYK